MEVGRVQKHAVKVSVPNFNSRETVCGIVCKVHSWPTQTRFHMAEIGISQQLAMKISKLEF